MGKSQENGVFELNGIHKNIAFVNVNRSLSMDSKDPDKGAETMGAASGAWIIKKEKRKACDYVAAVFQTEIRGFFKIEEKIPMEEVKDNIETLNKRITYPPHRGIEFIAAGCENVKEVKDKLGDRMYDLFKILRIDGTDEELEEKFKRWKRGRCYFILTECNELKREDWENCIPKLNGKPFRFYGGSCRVYLGKENAK